jgi:ribonuclease HI
VVAREEGDEMTDNTMGGRVAAAPVPTTLEVSKPPRLRGLKKLEKLVERMEKAAEGAWPACSGCKERSDRIAAISRAEKAEALLRSERDRADAAEATLAKLGSDKHADEERVLGIVRMALRTPCGSSVTAHAQAVMARVEHADDRIRIEIEAREKSEAYAKKLMEQIDAERKDLAIARQFDADAYEKVVRERDAHKAKFEAELRGALVLRGKFGARDDETFHEFVERLVRERDEARDDLRLTEIEHRKTHDDRDRYKRALEVIERLGVIVRSDGTAVVKLALAAADAQVKPATPQPAPEPWEAAARVLARRIEEGNCYGGPCPCLDTPCDEGETCEDRVLAYALAEAKKGGAR